MLKNENRDAILNKIETGNHNVFYKKYPVIEHNIIYTVKVYCEKENPLQEGNLVKVKIWLGKKRFLQRPLYEVVFPIVGYRTLEMCVTNAFYLMHSKGNINMGYAYGNKIPMYLRDFKEWNGVVHTAKI